MKTIKQKTKIPQNPYKTFHEKPKGHTQTDILVNKVRTIQIFNNTHDYKYFTRKHIMKDTKKAALERLTILLDAETPFRSSDVAISKEILQELITRLENFKPKNKNLTERRPPFKTNVSDMHTSYRKRMAEYISARIGTKLPGTSLIGTRFYNKIADYLDGNTPKQFPQLSP